MTQKTEIPTFVKDQFPGKDPIEIFKLCLGMHPTDEVLFKFEPKIQKEVEKLPIWYRARLEQIAMVTNEFELGDKLEVSVDKIICPVD